MASVVEVASVLFVVPFPRKKRSIPNFARQLCIGSGVWGLGCKYVKGAGLGVYKSQNHGPNGD